MGYSVKKAGVEFKAKVETSSDFTGQAAGFSAFYINDADGVKTDITGSFTEDDNASGLYFSPAVTIPTVGDYTIVINNSDAGMDNHPTPIVVTAATIDDIKIVVDDLAVTLADVAADVDGLSGADLTNLQNTLDQIKALIDDEDGATVNSVMEFVAQIDAALADGATGLAALSGFTDDVENMLLGTEFLADGTTSNPFYDATNPGVAKESSLTAALATLQQNIMDSATAGADVVNAARDAVIAKTDAIQAVVDANQSTLENAGFGLSALKDLIDGVATDVGTAETNILNVLNDASNGLTNIRSEMNTRFDAVDTALADIDTAVSNVAGAQGFRAFV